jgi:hypothetical protein
MNENSKRLIRAITITSIWIGGKLLFFAYLRWAIKKHYGQTPEEWLKEQLAPVVEEELRRADEYGHPSQGSQE